VGDWKKTTFIIHQYDRWQIRAKEAGTVQLSLYHKKKKHETATDEKQRTPLNEKLEAGGGTEEF